MWLLLAAYFAAHRTREGHGCRLYFLTMFGRSPSKTAQLFGTLIEKTAPFDFTCPRVENYTTLPLVNSETCVWAVCAPAALAQRKTMARTTQRLTVSTALMAQPQSSAVRFRCLIPFECKGAPDEPSGKNHPDANSSGSDLNGLLIVPVAILE